MTDTKNEDVAVAAHEQSTKENNACEKNEREKTASEQSSNVDKLLQDMLVLKQIVSFLKYMALFLAVWFVGRLGFGYMWVFFATIAFFVSKTSRDEKRQRTGTAQALAKNEEDAIRARLRDLPSWVAIPVPAENGTAYGVGTSYAVECNKVNYILSATCA